MGGKGFQVCAPQATEDEADTTRHEVTQYGSPPKWGVQQPESDAVIFYFCADAYPPRTLMPNRFGLNHAHSGTSDEGSRPSFLTGQGNCESEPCTLCKWGISDEIDSVP